MHSKLRKQIRKILIPNTRIDESRNDLYWKNIRYWKNPSDYWFAWEIDDIFVNYLNVPVADIRDFLNYGESSNKFFANAAEPYYSYSYSDLKRIEFDLIHCLIGLDKRIGRDRLFTPIIRYGEDYAFLKLFKDRIAHECPSSYNRDTQYIVYLSD